MKRRIAGGSTFAAVPRHGHAQAFPERPLHIMPAPNSSPAPGVRQKLTDGFLPVGGKPEAYGEVLAWQIAKWCEVIRDSNVPAPSGRVIQPTISLKTIERPVA